MAKKQSLNEGILNKFVTKVMDNIIPQIQNFIESIFKLQKKKYYTNKNFKKLIIYKNVKFI